MTSTPFPTFPVRFVIGDRPSDLPAGEVFDAARPLHGTPVTIPGLWNPVVVERDRYRLEDAVEANRRLDARLVRFVSEAEVTERCRVHVLGYFDGDSTEADAAIADLGDDLVPAIWPQVAVDAVGVPFASPPCTPHTVAGA